MNILITGCNGFVGSMLLKLLGGKPNFNVTGICRDKLFTAGSEVKILHLSNLIHLSQHSELLQTTDVIIHTAGKAHVLKKHSKSDEEEYLYVNTFLTKKLAEIASDFGVRKFIYLSSTKVFGNPTTENNFFNERSSAKPSDIYGESKYRAEKELFKVSNKTGIGIVIIRPPLVYGNGVKGNMELLSKLIRRNLPLPLGAISKNSRSMVSIENLADLITLTIVNSDATGGVFLVSDDHDLSTLEIIRLLIKHHQSKSKVFFVPIFILSLLGFITGKNRSIDRLVQSFKVDISHTKSALGWSAVQSVDEAFEKMVNNKLVKK